MRGSGDLGVLIERADGSVQILDGTAKTSLARVEGLGDLSHASLVFSRDQRYAYVFGRDGGLTKLDLLAQRIDKRLIQGGNSIGGAISQDGRLVAVSNYEPGGVKVFDSRTLELVAEIPATRLPGQDRNSRVVGLVDAPGQRFVFSLFDSGEIWIADFSQGDTPHLTRFRDIGKQPYDALISPDGRYYMAGLFGEDGMAQLDLWHPERGVRRVLATTAAANASCRCTRCRTWRAGPSPATRPSSRRSAITRCWCSTRATGSRPTPSTSPASRCSS